MSSVSPLRVVASYTTLPDRYDVLRRSIESMRAQTYHLDAIYLALPKTASRLHKEYPPLPDDFKNLCTVIPTDIDYGPITKVYGALMAEPDPHTVIISCDDDVIFAPDHVQKMVDNHRRYPNIAICGTGALIGKGLALISIVSTVHPFRPWNGMTGFQVDPVEGRKVDLIFGVAGILYRRGFFPRATPR
jgi:GT2 family glycosyltransferase